jgi:hypothetical protein
MQSAVREIESRALRDFFGDVIPAALDTNATSREQQVAEHQPRPDMLQNLNRAGIILRLQHLNNFVMKRGKSCQLKRAET